MRTLCGTILVAVVAFAAAAAPDPQTVFENPPLSARTGVWWHWMGSNGHDCGTVWCEPYEVSVPGGVLHNGENRLEIEFTNVWANRLIGDEQEPPDCDFAKAPFPGGWYLKRFPGWFKRGIETRPSSGRKCFTDWNYFTKDSPLVP